MSEQKNRTLKSATVGSDFIMLVELSRVNFPDKDWTHAVIVWPTFYPFTNVQEADADFKKRCKVTDGP